jgi:hypothetical protein
MQVGDKFYHTKWLDQQNKPVLMTVSKVQNGRVYYRWPGEKKAKHYFHLDEVEKYAVGVKGRVSNPPGTKIIDNKTDSTGRKYRLQSRRGNYDVIALDRSGLNWRYVLKGVSESAARRYFETVTL